MLCTECIGEIALFTTELVRLDRPVVEHALQSLRPGPGLEPFEVFLILRFISCRAFFAFVPRGTIATVPLTRMWVLTNYPLADSSNYDQLNCQYRHLYSL